MRLSRRPLPPRQTIYVSTFVLQALYLALAVPVANIEGIPLLPLLSLDLYGLAIGLSWVAGKLVLVHAITTGWPPSDAELLRRLAPSLWPKPLAVFAILCATTGVVEEITFRVIFPDILLASGIGALTVWIMSCVAFGLGHAAQGIRGCLIAGVLGGINLLLFWHLGSIAPLIVSHAVYDFIRGVQIAVQARTHAPFDPAPSHTQEATTWMSRL
jgi:hypothetical protein